MKRSLRRWKTEKIIKKRSKIVKKWQATKFIEEPHRLHKWNLNCNSPHCHPKTRKSGLPNRDKKKL